MATSGFDDIPWKPSHKIIQISVHSYHTNVHVAISMAKNVIRPPLEDERDLWTYCAQDCGDVWRDVCDSLLLGVSSLESQYTCYLTTTEIKYCSTSGLTILSHGQVTLGASFQRGFLRLHVISTEILPGHDAKVVEITGAELLQNVLQFTAALYSLLIWTWLFGPLCTW